MTDRPWRLLWWRRRLGNGRRGATDPARAGNGPEPEQDEHRTGHVLFTARRTPPPVEQRPLRVLSRARDAHEIDAIRARARTEPLPDPANDPDTTQRELESKYDTHRHVTDRGDRTERGPRPAVRVDDAAAASPAPRRNLSPSEALHLAERGRPAADGAPQVDADDEAPTREAEPEAGGTGEVDHPPGEDTDGGPTNPSG